MSNGLRVLDLLKKCCNGECDPTDGPSDEQMLEIFGLEISTTIKQLINLIGERRRHDISSPTMNNDIDKQIVKEYLEDKLNECKICDTLIILIETWIGKNKKVFRDQQLEADITLADSDKWIHGKHIVELYDDGTIMSQKESNLREDPILFIFASPLLHDFEIILPRKDLRDGRTYAILESESVAKVFRDRMLALTNKQ